MKSGEPSQSDAPRREIRAQKLQRGAVRGWTKMVKRWRRRSLISATASIRTGATDCRVGVSDKLSRASPPLYDAQLRSLQDRIERAELTDKLLFELNCEQVASSTAHGYSPATSSHMAEMIGPTFWEASRVPVPQLSRNGYIREPYSGPGHHQP